MHRVLTSTSLAACLLAISIVSGCRKSGQSPIGFVELDTKTRNLESSQSAKDVMSEIQRALAAYHEVHNHYPQTTEENLYDSIRSYLNPPMDPIHLYRNDNGRGWFIAVGGRANRIIYRYPPTVGRGEYTLYWVGPNGVDEEGEGDDLDAWATDANKATERRRLVDMTGNGVTDQLKLVRTGPDVYRDSARFTISSHDSVLYRDAWPLSLYFDGRPELTDVERNRIVHEELGRFFDPGAFVRTDSLVERHWGSWAEVKPNSAELYELVRANEIMFSYNKGAGGSRGVAWLPSKQHFVTVWTTGSATLASASGSSVVSMSNKAGRKARRAKR